MPLKQFNSHSYDRFTTTPKARGYSV